MAVDIKLKRSHTHSNIPTTSDLSEGEFAVNTYDGKMFMRDGSSNVVTVGSHYTTDFEPSTKTFYVTVGTKTSSHVHHGNGSSNGYKINGVFAPFLKLIPGITYRFDQSDGSNSGHPFRFYLDENKSTSYTTGVTTNGNAGQSGAYTEIVVSHSTPSILHYQCSAHGLMGWAAFVNTNNLTAFDTGDLTEGSNLYFTNARATSAITGSNLNMGSNNITTTGKILYSNLYSAEGDLPSASTYHGMFAHVHGTGKGYFAHAGGWIKLLDESSSSTSNLSEGSNLYFTNARADARIGAADIGDLSNVSSSSPSSGQVLKWNGSAWAPAADSSGGSITVQDEGSSLSTAATTFNFVGAGVVASGTGATKTITINAGAADTTDVRTNTLEVVGVTTFKNDVQFKDGTGTTKIFFDSSQDSLEFTDNTSLKFGSHSTGLDGSPTTGDYNISYVNGTEFGILAMQGGTQDLVIGRYENSATKKHLVSTRAGVIELYHDNSKKLETNSSGVTVTGTVAATTFSGSGASLTNLPAPTPTTSDIQVVYEITNQTSFSYFRFAGNGVDSSANNPDIYLERGQKYRFVNNSGGSHPFQIQTTGGSAYSTGVTNNNASSGNIDFAIRWDAPSQLKYQCTNHGSMQGNIYMTGGVGRWTQQSIVTLQSGSSHEFTGIPSEANEILIVFDGLSFASASNEPEFLLGNSGGYATSGYIISASYEPGGSYTKRTTSIRFLGLGAANYVPTGRLHLWRPVHNNNWWAEGIAYPWATEGEYQHRVVGTANSNGALTKIKVQGSGGANFDNTGNGKIQLSYLRY